MTGQEGNVTEVRLFREYATDTFAERVAGEEVIALGRVMQPLVAASIDEVVAALREAAALDERCRGLLGQALELQRDIAALRTLA